MATFIYNEGKLSILQAWLNAVSTARVALLMTNTTADTENDGIANVGDFTTLDEFNGANYVRKTLASGSVIKDDANDRANLDFADVTWTALGAGTRSIAGVLFYDDLGSGDAENIPVAWLEFATPKTPDGSDFVLNITDLLRLL